MELKLQDILESPYPFPSAMIMIPCHLFWYIWKEETISYTVVPIKCMGGHLPPTLGKHVTKKAW